MKRTKVEDIGLGDTVEKITKKTGIKSLVEKIINALGFNDCGCTGRKNFLNKIFPYKK
tara:strand:+ start:11241 stop:11414 length:174 start_codon:yes stop_codon:yes gene_type:complete